VVRSADRRSRATNLTFDLGEGIGGKDMANLKYDKEATALLVIDPYNDFISEGDKVWDRLKTVAEPNDLSGVQLSAGQAPLLVKERF
jgi:hypothetical protein